MRGALAGLLLAIAVLHAGGAAARQVVTLVGDPWPPYVNGKLGADAVSGIAVSIVRRIFAQIDGVEARFPLIPWKRALLEVEQGHSDGIGMLLKTAERERFLLYSVPLLTGRQLVWSRTGVAGESFEWNTLTDLHGRRLGVVEGYSYGEAMDAAFESGAATAVRGPTQGHLFNMLAAGRVDLVLANDAVGYALVRKLGDGRIRPASKATNTEVFHLGLSRRSAAVELMPQINAAIERLRHDGVIERLVRGEAVD